MNRLLLGHRLAIVALLTTYSSTWCVADDLPLTLRYQEATDGEAFRQLTRQETWRSEQTALIVCDVWDLHHSPNAVARVGELGPRLNEVVAEARRRGVTIIHAPSDCMAAYQDHPARERARQAPAAAVVPEDIESWCSRIQSEEGVEYPLDQSDGGSDDTPEAQADWNAKLKAMGRKTGSPWQAESDLIKIDEDCDFISDRGNEIWNILADRGIDNVILTGVHTNMCVLGRPFGLRQMARAGKNVVLMRDMTDTMYNPQRWPYVSHFAGTDLIVDHIERHVCPTISSDQLIGGEPFRFAGDTRPRVAPDEAENAVAYRTHWAPLDVPGSWADAAADEVRTNPAAGWYRCAVRVPDSWLSASAPALDCLADDAVTGVWCNGVPAESLGNGDYAIPSDAVLPDEVNLVVVRGVAGADACAGLQLRRPSTRAVRPLAVPRRRRRVVAEHTPAGTLRGINRHRV
ncbi:MAG: hypothetical protein R3C10_08560 [Pirellulales bacterium]